jgi:hypothetical protein
VDHPNPAPFAPPASAPPAADIPCSRCGYNLAGLDPGGVCPECGAPIAESLAGRLLRFSAPEYVDSLYRGATLIMTVILVQVVSTAMITGAALALAQGVIGPGPARTLTGLGQLTGFGLSVALWGGWWMCSAPDPAVRPGTDRGDKPRQWVRLAVAASAVMSLISTVAQFAGAPTPAGIGAVAIAGTVLLGLLGLAVAAVKFFASMKYLSWLGPRLPDPAVVTRARGYMWQLPLWTTVGMLLCGLGPLIAMILYYGLINRVRKDLRRVREEQRRPAPATQL